MVSKKEQWITFVAVNVFVAVAVALFPVYRAFMHAFPMPCGMVEYLHLYCPACGGTRALEALLSFDILRSLYCNPIVVSGALYFLIAEVYMIRHLIRKKERRSIIRMPVVLAVLGAWLAFFAVRNVLLLCGIDMLGDILV